MASRLRFLLLASLYSIGVSSSVAAAPPAVAPVASNPSVYVELPPVVVSDSQVDLENWLLTAAYSGQVVDIVGVSWKDCTGTSDTQHTMFGTGAPYTSAAASITAIEQGLFGSLGCWASTQGFLSWQFAFYSPTFDALGLGGQLLPIAFNFSGDATSSGICFGPTGCSITSGSALLIVSASGLGYDVINAVETGPTHVQMNTDFVGDMTEAWTVSTEVIAQEQVGPGTPGVPDGGSSMSVVSNLTITVDFALTETLIKAADPSLPQATIDQGLADLELIVSPGVDVASLAPQFVPEPASGALLGAGVVALASLARARSRRLSRRGHHHGPQRAG